jgi:hypothetical protein
MVSLLHPRQANRRGSRALIATKIRLASILHVDERGYGALLSANGLGALCWAIDRNHSSARGVPYSLRQSCLSN